MFRNLLYVIALLAAFTSLPAFAQHEHHHMHHGHNHMAVGDVDCAEDEAWDAVTAMCIPLANEEMPMTMLMVHGNAFAVATNQEGPRGTRQFAAPNMLMADAGTSTGKHYLDVNLMLTFERWTFPDSGYAEFLQIGEENNQGQPFIDFQHPHSSPIMGLTFSDYIHLDGRDYLKFSFAPRGQSTDGPIAFMHRPTGMANPDAPLGHHIGQDVGHISSTVLAAEYKTGKTRIEASAFHGTEPNPLNVDLPLGTPDSYSVRLGYDILPELMVMASYAYIYQPEPRDPDIVTENRYSASAYYQEKINDTWKLHDALIYGAVTNYDHASSLTSFAYELLVDGGAPNIWARLEVLQRTSAELQIPTTEDPNSGLWCTALALGYTHKVLSDDDVDFGLGASVTRDFLPDSFHAAYGGDPLTGRVFLRVTGAGMWML